MKIEQSNVASLEPNVDSLRSNVASNIRSSSMISGFKEALNSHYERIMMQTRIMSQKKKGKL